ncbi:MAG: hypothetical protein NC920_03130 [Candidatus Omnitrophica bacterium]|nr:hypothetical protein [Candidatus Omnitrophota bacterium]
MINCQHAVWEVEWIREAYDLEAKWKRDSARIKMRLVREGNNWLISGLENNTLFGSAKKVVSARELPDLTIDHISFHKVSPDAVSFVAYVYNVGNSPATQVKISFYQKPANSPSPFSLLTSKTIERIEANGEYSDMNAQHFFIGTPGVTYLFKVVIDPDNTIKETNENNNEITSSYCFD